jgi:signal transduction histidine kinase/ActR/RegA family two-component response regulator
MSNRRRSWFRDWPLRQKMLAILFCASALPLALTGILGFRQARASIERSTTDLLDARVQQIAGDIDQFHSSFLRSAQRLGGLPMTLDFLVGDTAGRASAAVSVRNVLARYTTADKRALFSALADQTGRLVAASDSALVGQDAGPTARAAMGGQNAISDVFVATRERGALPSIAYAVPVRDAGDRIVGAAILTAQASVLWEVVRAGNGLAGEGSFSVLYDQHGIRIAHSFNEIELFRPAGQLNPALVEELSAARRFGESTRRLLENPSVAPLEFERARAAAVSGSFRSFSPANGEENLVIARKLASVPWTLFYLVPESTVAPQVRRLVGSTLLSHGLAILLALGAGLFLASFVVEPIRAITRAADAIAGGDLGARVAMPGRDELGRLGTAFDSMADALSVKHEVQEQQVRARTDALHAAMQRLESQNLALEQRTAELTTRQTRDLAFGRVLAQLAGPHHLKELVQAAITETAQALETLLLVCFRLDGNKLLPLGSFGLKAVDEAPLDGSAASALEAGRVTTVELPPEAAFRFDVAVASGRPRYISLVPLTAGERRVGLIVGAAAGPLPPASLSFLSDLAVPLALTIARHELHEQTGKFAAELAGTNEELRRQSAELSRQKQELMVSQLQLEAKNREVERANQLKSEFLANMSHELRTPLNAVIGFSDMMLEDRKALRPEHATFAEDILKSGKHLLSLINSILDLAKIESGHLELELEPVAPGEAVEDAASLITPMAQKRGVKIEKRLDAVPTVRADRAKLQQMLLNLLSNAAKFSPEGGTIVTGVEPAGAFVRFFVSDSGPGITSQVLSELFQPFVQGERSLVKRHEGTGLGLAITRRLVEEHGGAIDVKTAPGQGSTFSFTLPVEGEVPAQPRPFPARSVTAIVDSPTVVVIDDHENNRTLARVLLERRGYRVHLAQDGAEGVELVRKTLPHLVFMDLSMPAKNGFEALRELRADPRTSGIPVIAFTALAMRGDEERALRAGFDGYLSKPVERHDLDEILRRFLGAQAAS